MARANITWEEWYPVTTLHVEGSEFFTEPTGARFDDPVYDVPDDLVARWTECMAAFDALQKELEAIRDIKPEE